MTNYEIRMAKEEPTIKYQLGNWILRIISSLVNSSLVILLLSQFSLVNAATWLDPSLTWKTLETKHFSIHFHDNELAIAKKIAVIAEEVHATLHPIFGMGKGLKTNVLILDNTDQGNGWATVMPDNRVALYVTDWSSNLNPSKHDDWLRFLFTHEYTHIKHLGILDGYPLYLNLMFGRLIFPNGSQPWFFIEGMATYFETHYNQGGRGDDPRWDMMMRMDILENNFRTIDQAGTATVNWPMRTLWYLYGVEFIEYLADTYGQDKLIDLAYAYNYTFYTIGIDGALLMVYDKTLKTLWNEWQAHLKHKYRLQKIELGDTTKPTLVTNSGYYNLKPKWSKDSLNIYYQQYNADGYPSIRQTGKSGNKKLVEASVLAHNLSLDPSGTNILFTKTDTHKNYYSYKDLWNYNTSSKKTTKLTDGQRALDADYSPDGKSLVFVQNKLGTHTLNIMDLKTREIKLLTPNDTTTTQYFSPRFSPNGKKIVVAKWETGGQQKIHLINVKTGNQWRLSTEDSLVSEANPCFTPDGQYIVFDSDRSGIVNLYAFHIKSKKLYQLTNMLGGAMMPDVSPDGSTIAYASYSSKGYDIAIMPFAPKNLASKTSILTSLQNQTRLQASLMRDIKHFEHITKPETKPQPKPSVIHDYQPWFTLMPKFWLPLTYYNENGSQTYFYTQGQDILGHHSFAIALGYDFDINRSQYTFQYTNNQLLPQLTFMTKKQALPYSWLNTTFWMQENYDQVSMSLYDNRVFSEWDRQVVSVGYEQTRLSTITSASAVATLPSLGNIKGAFVSWRYLSARQYAKSISPEDGLDLSLAATLNTPNLGSDYDFTTYSGTAKTYLKTLIKHHILAPTLSGFYSKGDQLAQSNFTWRYLTIRGYPSTNMSGNKGLSLSTEYRFPISYPETGILHGYTFFDKVWGNIFYDLGGATNGALANLTLKKSYGLELCLNTLFMYGYSGVTFKIGVVKGVDSGGEQIIYFSLGI